MASTSATQPPPAAVDVSTSTPQEVLLDPYVARSNDGLEPAEEVADEIAVVSDQHLQSREAAPMAVVVHRATSSPPQAVGKDRQKLPPALEALSIWSHLAFFSIAGVAIRYGLEKLFGPEVANVTSDSSVAFIDLPANMLGSFVMGWVGMVFKKDLLMYSEPLAIGLSTGLCGSITTFASWNQRMLAILTTGLWVRALAGYLLGLELAYVSFQVGIDSAQGFAALVEKVQSERERGGRPRWLAPKPEHLNRRWASLVLFFPLSVALMIAAAIGTSLDVKVIGRRYLWLALATAPFGTLVRYFLSRLNGRGLGQRRYLQWLPIGTLATNTLASMLEAVLSVTNLAATNSNSTLIIGALQLGFCGCMSTVSTLVNEMSALHAQPPARWRAYAYPLLSIFVAFVLGVVIYSTPVWLHNFPSRYNHI